MCFVYYMPIGTCLPGREMRKGNDRHSNFPKYFINLQKVVYMLPVPTKHETLKQCWLKVGPTSATLAQH